MADVEAALEICYELAWRLGSYSGTLLMGLQRD
jgi:hypothetical protein